MAHRAHDVRAARPRYRLSSRLGLAIGLAMLLATSCRPADGLPPTVPVVTVVMHEYRFDNPKVVGPGRVVFHLVNAGKIRHRAVIVPLPEDYLPILEQLHGTVRRHVQPLAGVADQEPGATGAVAVDLLPGRYALICFDIASDGRSHADKGMASEFRVPGTPVVRQPADPGPPTGPSPSPDQPVRLKR